jgi:hypothetical protein
MTTEQQQAGEQAQGNGGAQADRRLHVTFFFDEYAKQLDRKELTLSDLCDLIQIKRATKKSGLPWLKLGTFGDKKTSKGSLRHDDNVISISGIEGDYDLETISFQEAAARIEAAHLCALIYTSPNHSPERPRWRILCPTSCDLPPQERGKLLNRLNGLFCGGFSGESWTLSQSYYFGRVGGNPAHTAECFDGEYIDLRHDLDAGAIGKQDNSKAKSNGGGSALGIEAHLARLGDGPGLDGFHKPLRDAIAAYVAIHGANFDREAVEVATARTHRSRTEKQTPRLSERRQTSGRSHR